MRHTGERLCIPISMLAMTDMSKLAVGVLNERGARHFVVKHLLSLAILSLNGHFGSCGSLGRWVSALISRQAKANFLK